MDLEGRVAVLEQKVATLEGSPSTAQPGMFSSLANLNPFKTGGSRRKSRRSKKSRKSRR